MIIWGTKCSPTTVQQGNFFCPICFDTQAYHQDRVRKLFTLYFIPLFPIENLAEYIECQNCKGTFSLEVLSYDPAESDHRFKAEFESAILHTLGMMLLADGKAEDSEIQAITEIYHSVTGLDLPREEVDAVVAEVIANPASPIVYLRNIAPQLNEHGKELVIKAVICLAGADGDFGEAEVETLQEIAGALEMSAAHLSGVIRMMNTPEDAEAV